MISGLDFSSETIASTEKKYIEQFYKSDDPLLSDSIRYYSILFLTFLQTHEDKKFSHQDRATKKVIFDKEMSSFRTAMRYAFNKGHQIAFSLLLMKQSQEFSQDFFESPNSHDDFLYTYETMVTTDVFNDTLRRDAIDNLIKYTRRNFENGYNEIISLGTRFYKKGIGVGFEQIRKYIVQRDYKITGYSKMLSVPYNQSFTVTPAFKATFSLEHQDYEEWDLHWDETYGFNAAKGMLAKAMINHLNVGDVRSYAQKDASTYKMINQFSSQDFQDSDVVYLIRIDFLVTDTENFPRLLQNSEYNAIKLALKQTIRRRLKVDNSHLFITN
ncbi:hypothetical protein ACKN8S_13625 (plasmid) [Limosilactobacillus reuteri]|uniref:hypothetical protein n=1 Tax=Limosilactobacillus reuteri TaxID=1598 RepID=UPI0039BFADD6